MCPDRGGHFLGGSSGSKAHKADAAALPFTFRSFDAITCTHAFHEWRGAARDRTLREIVRVFKPGKAFVMVEHDRPENPVLRFLYYLRLVSMGSRRAVSILRSEKNVLDRYFSAVERMNYPSGRSKILICRN